MLSSIDMLLKEIDDCSPRISFFTYVLKHGIATKGRSSTTYTRSIKLGKVRQKVDEEFDPQVSKVKKQNQYPDYQVDKVLQECRVKVDALSLLYEELMPNGIYDFGKVFDSGEYAPVAKEVCKRWKSLPNYEQKWADGFLKTADKYFAVLLLFFDYNYDLTDETTDALFEQIFSLIYQYAILDYEGFLLKKRAGKKRTGDGITYYRKGMAKAVNRDTASNPEEARDDVARLSQEEQALQVFQRAKWSPLSNDGVLKELKGDIEDVLKSGLEKSVTAPISFPCKEGKSGISPVVFASAKLYNDSKKKLNSDAYDTLFRQKLFEELLGSMKDFKGKPIEWQWCRDRDSKIPRYDLLGRDASSFVKWRRAGALFVDWLWEAISVGESITDIHAREEAKYELIKDMLVNLATSMWEADPIHDYNLISLYPVANLSYQEADEDSRDIKNDYLAYLSAATLASALYGPSVLPEIGLSFNMFRGSSTTRHLSDLLQRKSESFLQLDNDISILITMSKPNADSFFSADTTYCGLYRLDDGTCYHIGSNPPSQIEDEVLRQETIITLGDVSHSRHAGDLRIVDGAMMFNCFAQSGGWHYKPGTNIIPRIEQLDPIRVEVGDTISLVGDAWNVNITFVQMMSDGRRKDDGQNVVRI